MHYTKLRSEIEPHENEISLWYSVYHTEVRITCSLSHQKTFGNSSRLLSLSFFDKLEHADRSHSNPKSVSVKAVLPLNLFVVSGDDLS